ncbi:MAG: SDR family NAD(P)-dependent oxidoreductase [Myxococcota bacterium]|nr:SDR family NAD(P)-dependent oxidoreductase [Myxococcota bacterium]
MRAPERVLITGATSGLGEAVALRFAREGARIAVTGRNAEKLERAAERVGAAGAEVLPIPLEVTRLEDFEKAAAEIEERWGGLDWLVNNAGVASGAPLEDWTYDSWRHVLDVNLWSVVYGCRVFGPLLQKQGGGYIVNVASAASFVAAPEMASYSASKAAVVSVSETLRSELAPQGIHVTVSCPGLFKTDLLNPEKIEADDKGERILENLAAEMDRATLTADQVAVHLIRCARRGRLYSVPGLDTKTMWLMKRYFPEWNRRALSFLFRKRLWRFSHLDDGRGGSTG